MQLAVARVIGRDPNGVVLTVRIWVVGNISERVLVPKILGDLFADAGNLGGRFRKIGSRAGGFGQLFKGIAGMRSGETVVENSQSINLRIRRFGALQKRNQIHSAGVVFSI